MCIIVAKPAGKELPSKQTLRNCYDNNNDGAGFMYANGKTVRIHKGFFDFEDFYDTLMLLDDIKGTSIVMHFRISTHGSVNKACCHPFPVSDDIGKLSAVDTENRVCVAHNGVINGMATSKDKSDTMAYIADVIAPLRRMHEDFMHDDNALDVLRHTCGSKLCFLDNSGDIVTVGEFHEVDGVLFSNHSYAQRTWGYSSYASWWDKHLPSYEYDDDAVYGKNGISYAVTPAKKVEDYGDFDAIEEALSHLPYLSCMVCDEARECALDKPFCQSEVEADEFAKGGVLYGEEETADYLL